MKQISSIGMLVLVLILHSLADADDGGFVFGVKPSANLQTSYFGVETGNFVLYTGLDILAIGVKTEGKDSQYYTDYYGDVWRRETSYEYSGSAFLIAPRLGAKWRLSSHILRPYLMLDFFKVFPFVNVDSDETTRTYRDGILENTYHSSEDNSEEEDAVEDILGIYGFNFGFGAEYYFSKNFSIGGEYVFRWFATSATDEGGETYNEGSPYESGQTWKDELSASLKMSYAAIVMNYYF